VRWRSKSVLGGAESRPTLCFAKTKSAAKNALADSALFDFLAQ
jgi:hypothetical protein